jgi:hypothetical protein
LDSTCPRTCLLLIAGRPGIEPGLSWIRATRVANYTICQWRKVEELNPWLLAPVSGFESDCLTVGGTFQSGGSGDRTHDTLRCYDFPSRCLTTRPPLQELM